MNREYSISIDTISFKLKEVHDFSWLIKFGKPFIVFDQQDSGNICFGVEKNGYKLFVKYAGAKTMEYQGHVDDAIVRLKEAVPIYNELQHPILIKLADSFSTEEGYAAVFEWVEGECLHDHWNFEKYPKYTHPDSTFYRFKHLPVQNRLKALNCIFHFHAYVEKKGYVADDFYDGSILYDFKYNEIRICDIDFYKKKPHINVMLWGSKRYNSPENNLKGAILDEITNVYNMGAVAFSLIGGELNRTYDKWEGPESLFRIAQRATMENRIDRYSSVNEFYEEWNKAIN
jgi:serine/threonine-protein kinase